MINRLRRKPKKWLTLEDCETLFRAYKKAASRVALEPIPPFENRYPGILESVLGSIEQSWNRKHLYPTILDASAAYLNKFVRSQCFVNGNKRLGFFFTHYFLITNGIDFTLKSNEIFNLVAFVAESADKNHIKQTETLILCRKIISKFTKEI